MKELIVYIIGVFLAAASYFLTIDGVLKYFSITSDQMKSQFGFFVVVIVLLITDRLAHSAREAKVHTEIRAQLAN